MQAQSLQVLERSGIQFIAHDLRKRQERFSPYDLLVLGFRGDVKSSTYFLHAARSYPLANDFYLVRIYDVARRTWLDIAMMKPAMWQAIEGDTTPCELDKLTQLLPTPLQIVTRDEALIVISYDDWKQHVLRIVLPWKNYHDREDFVAQASCLLSLQTGSLRYVRIVSNPQVLGGKPCVKGTRIPVYYENFHLSQIILLYKIILTYIVMRHWRRDPDFPYQKFQKEGYARRVFQ